jgi:hypothetical protein
MNHSVEVRERQIKNAAMFERVGGPMYPKIKVPVCCDDFADAMASGTDSEGFGPAIKVSNAEIVVGGMYGSKAQYCPFCGTDITRFLWLKSRTCED